MSKWENTTMTQHGQDMLDALIAGTKKMNITRAVVGSGTVAVTKLATQTEVTGPVQEATLGDVFIVDGAVTIPVIITNTNLNTGYTAKQIGIFAQAEGEEEILFFIAQSDTNGQDIPSKDEPPHGFTAEFHFTIDTGTVNNMTITVNSAGLLTTSVADQRYEKKSVIKTYAITPDMFTGDAFPYTCIMAHGLGSEPVSMPMIDLDITSYDTAEDIEGVEAAYGVLYRATFSSETMTIYAKEIPEVGFAIKVKAVI